jgi:predicted nuclease of predicted toxin-antitoxin system
MMKKRLKLLFDVGVSRKAEVWLKENGYDIKAIRDINSCLSDKEILEIAVNEDRMIVTMDKDFGELIYKSGLIHSGVLLLRL